MKRGSFIKSMGALGAITLSGMTLKDLEKISEKLGNSEKMPVMFVGHGNPMNAIEDNEFSRGWRKVSAGLNPSLILCISAHWETRGSYVTGNLKPRTIHDFGGFPQALFDVQYPAPGSPETAQLIKEHITEPRLELTEEWGLDHGTWSVLAQMFPKAEVPVLQLSLDRNLGADQAYALAKQLRFLRTRGVLIIGSGNIVHNLRMARWGVNPEPYDWALAFDMQVKQLVEQREHRKLIDYPSLGNAATLSIPTREHYLPLLYTLALQEKNDELTWFNEGMAFGSGSMRSLIIH